MIIYAKKHAQKIYKKMIKNKKEYKKDDICKKNM